MDATATTTVQSALERDYALLLARKARKKLPEFLSEEEISLVPYLDVMMNLVIFMLVTIAAFMPLGILSIFPPSVSKDPGPGTDELPKITLTVAISDTGFIIAGSGAVLPAIPKKPSGEYDYETLHTNALEIKKQYPEERTVVIVADEQIRYEVLIKTMDALRSMEEGTGEKKESKPLFDDVKLSAAAG